MDIDRNKINEIKSECLQMPDYIRDMIEETVEQQLKKKQHHSKKMWRVAAAILAFACVGGGTTLAATKLYKMHLEQQGKYSSTLERQPIPMQRIPMRKWIRMHFIPWMFPMYRKGWK